MKSMKQRPFAFSRIFLSFIVAAGLAVTAVAQNSIFDIQSSPSPDGFGNTLNAVTALSATDAWAVGYRHDNNLNDSRTLTLHWDGASWKGISSPNPGTTPRCQNSNSGNVLNAVSAVSPNDVWAVGLFFSCSSLIKPLALHWDGVKWNSVPTPQLRTSDNSAFNGVLAFASNDVYAVGYTPAANNAALTLLEHWDGTSWSIVPTPNANQTGNYLYSIAANSPTDIWLVGAKVAPNVPVRTLTLHFDGATWKVVPSPNPQQSFELDQNVLLSVRAVSASDVTAVGYILDSGGQRELTLIEHWDGTRWKVVPSPNQSTSAGSLNRLTSLASVSGTNQYATGFFEDAATNGQHTTLVTHFDGVSWTTIPSPTKGLAQQLNGTFTLPGSADVWVVGGSSRFGIDFEDGFLQVPQTLVLFSPIG